MRTLLFLACVALANVLACCWAASAPYLATAKGGARATTKVQVDAQGSTRAVSTASREVNTALTESLEYILSSNRPGPRLFQLLGEIIEDIGDYCEGRDECWLSPRVNGVRIQSLYALNNLDGNELFEVARREQTRTNLFRFFDTNEDYRISVAEHLQGLCQLMQRNPQECSTDSFREENMPIFERSDTNGNRVIDFDEFEARKSREYSRWRLPYAHSPVQIPVFHFVMSLYENTYHYTARQLLLLLTRVLVRIEPTRADIQQDSAPDTNHVRVVSPVQLGMLPAAHHALIAFPLDVTLCEAILMRGAGSFHSGLESPEDFEPTPLRPFLLTDEAWAKVGPASRSTESGLRAAKALPPIGTSALMHLRGAKNDDVTVGVVKVLFMAMDAVNLGAASSIKDGFQLMTSGPREHLQTDQGHAYNVVYQALHSASETFRRWEREVDADTSKIAVLHRLDALRILQELSIYYLGPLAHADLDDGDSSDLSEQQRSLSHSNSMLVRDAVSSTSTHTPLLSTADDAPNPALLKILRSTWGYKIDMREILVTSLTSGRTVLHDIGIAGYAELTAMMCDVVHATASTDGGAAGRAFVKAMRQGDYRLGRTPLHFAAHWYGDGPTYQALMSCAETLGADVEELLSFKDDMGFTPVDYINGKQHIDITGDTETVNRVFAAVSEADKISGLVKSEQPPDRQQKQQGGWTTATQSTRGRFTRTEPEGDFSLDDGGWNDLAEDAPSKQFEFLYDIPNWHGPDSSVHDINTSTVAMRRRPLEGGSYLGAEVFEGMPTKEQMLAVVNSHRPVIFRGALRDMLINRTVWSKSEFLRNYGDKKVKIADIPYRSTFSSMIEGTIAEKSVLMAEYIEEFGSDEHIVDGIPLYMFSASFTHDHPELNDECQEIIDFMNSIPGLQDLHGGQFFVGPEGSGAPVHFHSSAVNALYYGRKRWILIPPMQAFYSVKPAAAFFRDDIEDARQHYDMYEFIQEAGDLVYVPDYYGHGTVNLQTSIGIAFEFENFNHKLFNNQVDSLQRLQVTVPGSYRQLDMEI